jgi:hypothetical protein
MLKHHFEVNNIKNIMSGVVWQIKSNNSDTINRAIETNIFFNPFSHDCYEI